MSRHNKERRLFRGNLFAAKPAVANSLAMKNYANLRTHRHGKKLLKRAVLVREGMRVLGVIGKGWI